MLAASVSSFASNATLKVKTCRLTLAAMIGGALLMSAVPAIAAQ